KGDIARAMLYMTARYYTYIDVLHPKLELVNGSPSAIVASTTQSGLAGDLETLLLWNELDPVDEYEIRRNNLIFNNYQLNRNPFIDHPEWARIAYDTSYSGSGASVAPESSSVGLGVVDPTDLVSISVTNNPSKVDYYVGATLDPTGLVITGTQSDNNIVTVANYTLTINGSSSLVLNTVGVNVVTVTVDTLTTTFNVFVGAKENLTLSPANATIAYNAEFDNSIISGSFSYTTANGTFTENVANADLSFGVYDTKNLGANLINVTHKSLSTSFTLTVTNLNASQPIATTNDLFFSEYIEGSSYNKALEIYNGTGEEKSLTSYSVHLFSNGATSPVTTLNLTGNIQNNDVYVISYSSADLVDITSQSDITSGVTNFNGDDAIGLYKNDILIDLIGVIGSDPGSAWTGTASNGAGSTVDKTLRRTETVSEPNTVFTWSEWEVYANDTTSDIGLHTFIGTSIDSEKYHLDQALAYAHFLLDETAPYCSVLNGGDSPWSYLQVEYSYMSAETKYAFYYNSTNEYILAAKARYEYLINKYSLVAFIDDGAGNILNARQTPNDYFTAEFENYIIIIAGFILFGFLFYSFSKKSSKA
ncbi:MAG: endonuclease, partial [Bacilli bacterium]